MLNKDNKISVADKPCGSCPYRKDVPSGIWNIEEYSKLPKYDGTIEEQIKNQATNLFLCHQRDNNFCAGWLACHKPENLLAIRLFNDHIDTSKVYKYKTSVPVFLTGLEAAKHGIKNLHKPSKQALNMIKGLQKKGL